MKEEVKAGITVVAALAILSAFTILTGGSKLFEDYDRYYVKVMNAAGLEQGAQVRIGGVRAGRVLDIKAPEGPGEKITIMLGIRKGHAIYKGTKAVISQVGFVGDIYLLLTVDGTVDEKIPPGSVIPSRESVDFGLLMSKVDAITESVQALVKDVDRLFSESTIGNIGEAVKNLNSAASELRKLIGGTRDDLDTVMEKISDDLDEAKEAVRAVEGSAIEIGKAAKSAGKTAESVTAASERIEEAVKAQSRNITSLIGTIEETAETLDGILQEIKNKPWGIIYKEEGR